MCVISSATAYAVLSEMVLRLYAFVDTGLNRLVLLLKRQQMHFYTRFYLFSLHNLHDFFKDLGRFFSWYFLQNILLCFLLGYMPWDITESVIDVALMAFDLAPGISAELRGFHFTVRLAFEYSVYSIAVRRDPNVKEDPPSITGYFFLN